jgi:AraC family transcriptional regulator
MISVQMGAHSHTDPDVDDLVLTLPSSVSERSEWAWTFGDGWKREPLQPGRMLVTPPNTESSWQVEGGRDLLVLVVPSQTIKSVLGPASPYNIAGAFEPLASQSWQDDLVQLLLSRLWTTMTDARVTDKLFIEGAIVTLMSQMLRLAGTLPDASERIAISPARLRHVKEYADAHLDAPLDLSGLAEVAGLSVRHFARAFRQQTGETPHKWLMQLRTERAKQLLAKRDASLKEIADLCGFADQSHMTTMIKKATGMTPRKWREALAT